MKSMKKIETPNKINFTSCIVRNQFNIFQHFKDDAFGYTIDVLNSKGKLIAIFRQSFSDGY